MGNFDQCFNEGGWNVDQYFNTVLKFDAETETWIEEEESLFQPRGGPGVSTVKYHELEQYCQESRNIPVEKNTVLIDEVKIVGGTKTLP